MFGKEAARVVVRAGGKAGDIDIAEAKDGDVKDKGEGGKVGGERDARHDTKRPVEEKNGGGQVLENATAQPTRIASTISSQPRKPNQEEGPEASNRRVVLESPIETAAIQSFIAAIKAQEGTAPRHYPEDPVSAFRIVDDGTRNAQNVSGGSSGRTPLQQEDEASSTGTSFFSTAEDFHHGSDDGTTYVVSGNGTPDHAFTAPAEQHLDRTQIDEYFAERAYAEGLASEMNHGTMGPLPTGLTVYSTNPHQASVPTVGEGSRRPPLYNCSSNAPTPAAIPLAPNPTLNYPTHHQRHTVTPNPAQIQYYELPGDYLFRPPPPPPDAKLTTLLSLAASHAETAALYTTLLNYINNIFTSEYPYCASTIEAAMKLRQLFERKLDKLWRKEVKTRKRATKRAGKVRRREEQRMEEQMRRWEASHRAGRRMTA